MTLEQVKREAADLFQKWECVGWKVEFWNSTQRLGECDYKNKIVWMNEFYCLNNTDEKVSDTLKHEVAHIKAGQQARHGAIWIEWCRRIGCTPRACSKQANMPGTSTRRRLKRD